MKIIGVFTVHDSNVTISVDGEVKVALELERVTGIKHYPSPNSKREFVRVWTHAINVVTKFVGITHFDVCVSNSCGKKQLKLFKEIISADKWVEKYHHPCHASIGFYDSPFRNAMIISSDGRGNETSCEVFLGNMEMYADQGGITSLEQPKLSFGRVNEHVAAMLPEVAGANFWGDQDDDDLLTHAYPYTDAQMESDVQKYFSLAGKAMGYAALGNVRQEWLEGMAWMFTRCDIDSQNFYWCLLRRLALDDFPEKDKTTARDLAATSQYAFSEAHYTLVETHLTNYYSDLKNPPLDGVVITGGCGQNVCMNQLILDKIGLPMHVACAPNDSGIATGACWLVEPPLKPTQIMYAGLPILDGDGIDELARERGARKVSVSDVADLLMKHDIVGVVRGRSEYGPRALGNRSLLAYPDKIEQLEKINKLKKRQFYRPACPSVTEDSAVKIFKGRLDSDRFVSHEPYLKLYEHDNRFANGQNVKRNDIACLYQNDLQLANFIPRSPYMSFAPTMRDECRQMFPACCHFDNTARLQTVSKETNPWFHSILQEIGKHNGGYEILINTSFNIKGQPILNTLHDALYLLDQDNGLSHVVCEDWLFSKNQQ